MSKKKAGKPTSASTIVVFGLDEDGKTRAGKFAESQKALALKAASLMKFEAYEVDVATAPDLYSKIPAGRLYSNGRGFIPPVRRDRFAKLAEALGVPDKASWIEKTNETLEAKGLPEDWQSITTGHLVLARAEIYEDGWWEAVVTKCEDDILTLRFRDYPNYPAVKCHRMAVSLLNPAPSQ